ncbi:ATP-dependent Clp protease adapter ClpS [Dermabacter sp. p3-SID358]|uniref:ATP-dependent Clp protease adapter ClpS n=1 Tax=Dermabacter sp. p3-SID358 TaxID=2916114 RepID=UPI0021A34488|nr:ATP-dependent Clp protease adapter ClpS [Dermabacter sp. p3-SID358]MCT1866768.1 ATP-dependent Clp protease adapter ClpS [Dermabacter sp. p3-SID358]
MREKSQSEPLASVGTETDRKWNTVVLNDAVNEQTYVTYVFRTHFGYARSKAHALMMQVHTEGRAIVSCDGREKAESHVGAMHEFGLLAILEEA